MRQYDPSINRLKLSIEKIYLSGWLVLIKSAKVTDDGQMQPRQLPDGQEQMHTHDDLGAKSRGQPRYLDRFADTAGANGIALPTVDRAVDQSYLVSLRVYTCSLVAMGAREARRRCANSPMRPSGIGSSIQVGSNGSRACTILVA